MPRIQKFAPSAPGSGLLHGDHAGDLTGERGRKVARRHLQLAGLDRLDGTHQRLLLLHAEADDHDILQFVRGVDERHQLEKFAVLDRDLLHVVAEEREGHLPCRGRHGKRIVAVDVGRHAERRPLDIDVGPHDGLVVRRGDDRTGERHRTVLRHSRTLPGPLRNSHQLVVDRVTQRSVQYFVEHGLDRCIFERGRDGFVDIDLFAFEKERVTGLLFDLLQHRFQGNAPKRLGNDLRMDRQGQQQPRDQCDDPSES